MAYSKRIYLSSPHMSDEKYEMGYIQKAFKDNWIAPVGENIDEFEREFAKKTGSKSAVALCSGTAAIHMALKATGIKPGDRVFCSTLTFSASVNPIIYENAIPVFIDSDYKTWNMCPAALERALKKHKPKALILVHIYGLSADIETIADICKKNEIVLMLIVK